MGEMDKAETAPVARRSERSDMFDRWFGEFPRPRFWPDLRRTFGEDVELIKVEELQDDGHVVVRAELPGIDPDRDVQVSVVDHTLRLQAERRQEKQTEDQRGTRTEFQYGSFVYFGASVEETATLMHLRLRGRRVDDVMVLEPLIVDSSKPVAQSERQLRASNQRVFPVVGPSGYEGLIDITAIGQAPGSATAGSLIACSDQVTSLDSIEDTALAAIVASPLGAAAVIENKMVVGVVRVEDIEHLLATSTTTTPHAHSSKEHITMKPHGQSGRRPRPSWDRHVR